MMGRPFVTLALWVAMAALGQPDPSEGAPVLPAPRTVGPARPALSLVEDDCLLTADTSDPSLAAAAEVFNQRIAALGGTPIPLRMNAPTTAPAVWIDISVDPSLGQPQGYHIDVTTAVSSVRVNVIGADSLGALYGAVTLAHYLERTGGEVVLTPRTVRDWPDVLHRMVVGFPEMRALYMDYDGKVRERSPEAEALGTRFESGMRELVDWMVWNKMNGLEPFTPVVRNAHQAALWDRLGNYMRPRGVTLTLIKAPYVGSAATSLRGCVVHGTSEYCWSDDETHRKGAAQMAQKMVDLPTDHFMLHLLDHGGPDPEMWSQRCESCRTRFGDNRARADTAIFMHYYTAIRAVNPSCRIELVPVPYKAKAFYDKDRMGLVHEWRDGGLAPDVMARMNERARRYFERMNDLLPHDVHICLREHGREPARQYKEAFGNRPLTLWWWQFPARAWQTGFHTLGRFTRTWDFDDRRDIIFATGHDKPPTRHLVELFNNEYAWRLDAPGSAVMDEAYDFRTETDWLTAPANVVNPWLEAATTQLYGEALAPAMADIARRNVSVSFIVQPRVARVTNYESHFIYSDERALLTDLLPVMAEQAQSSEAAVAALLAALQTTPNVPPRFAGAVGLLCRTLHAAQGLAGGKAAVWAADRALLNSKPEAARAHIAAGRAALTMYRQRAAAVAEVTRTLPVLEPEAGSADAMILATDIAVFEETLRLTQLLANRPALLTQPQLKVRKDAWQTAQIPARFPMPIEPHGGLMTDALTLEARQTEEGVEMVFHGQESGLPNSRIRTLQRDTMLSADPTEIMEHVLLYVRRQGGPEARVFGFDPRGNQLDGKVGGDIGEAARVEWDPRWRYHMVRRPNFLKHVDLAWQPTWRVDVAKEPSGWTATLVLPWEALGTDPGTVDGLEVLIEHVWRSGETYGPAEFGRVGDCDGRWVPLVSEDEPRG
ncbi:MAG: hypothetical protein HQ523_07920 [Lentisphaerae bacterium]|nr:hypothetical protein [Lentisphaerota bacterium]